MEENKLNVNTESNKSLTDKKDFPWLFAIISVFLLSIAGIIIYLVISPSKAGETILDNKETLEQKIVPSSKDTNSEFIVDKSYSSPYKLQNIYEGKDWTGKISLIDEQNNVLIDDMREIFPSMKRNKNQYLEIIASPKDTDYIIFDVRVGKNNGLLYRVNLKDKSKFRLEANKVYVNQFSKNYLSPDQKHLLMLDLSPDKGFAQNLVVIDLITGLYKEYKLENNETYNAGWQFKKSFVQANWLDNNTFKVAIFDQSKKDEEPNILANPYEPDKEYLLKIYKGEKKIVIDK